MKIAFITTNFGFGPVAKTNYLIQEFLNADAKFELTFIGYGIALEYIKKNGIVTDIIELDYFMNIEKFKNEILNYDRVINVMEMDILKYWNDSLPPIEVVDSLAWMWPTLPLGIELAETYYVQDNHLEIEANQFLCVNQKKIEPITIKYNPSIDEKNNLLVNFSGMHNTFLSEDLAKNYCSFNIQNILNVFSDRFDEITFTTNENLVDRLRQKNNFIDGFDCQVKIECLPHDKFIEKLSEAALFLSTPGLTANLEARILHKRVGYLLPTNYSQYLLSNKYSDRLNTVGIMQFSNFNFDFLLADDCEEGVAVSYINEVLKKILDHFHDEYGKLFNNFLSVDWENTQRNSISIKKYGQEQIVEDITNKYREEKINVC